MKQELLTGTVIVNNSNDINTLVAAAAARAYDTPRTTFFVLFTYDMQ